MSPSFDKVRFLAEGGDDQHFVKHFLARRLSAELSLDWIVNCKGIQNTLQTMSVIGKQTGYRAVIVVCDADSDFRRRWKELRAAVCDPNTGESFLPEVPDPQGTIAPFVRDTRLAVWMMPDNQNPGSLETFLEQIRSTTHPQLALWERAQQSVHSIPQEQRLFDPRDMPKAHVRTWLAWQKEPGAAYGLAVNLDCFDLNHPLASSFADWLSRIATS